MNKEQLRPIMIGNHAPQKGYFHIWIKKAYDDENYRCEHAWAVVETESGEIREVRASEISFTDR